LGALLFWRSVWGTSRSTRAARAASALSGRHEFHLPGRTAEFEDLILLQLESDATGSHHVLRLRSSALH
jgi:hypothetical protein